MNPNQKQKLVFLRSITTSFGGAEVFLSRLCEELRKQNISFKILHSSAPQFLPSWVKAWWFNWEAKLRKQPDEFYFSLDRIDSADIYRAGDGVHKAFLKTRSFSLNPLHLTYLILEKRCFKNSKHIICNSYFIKKQIQDYYRISEDKISVIPNGISLPVINTAAKKKICQEFSIDINRPIILFVGSGFYRKGLPEFLNLISKIQTPFHAFIIGKEKKLSLYLEQAKTLNLLSKISFTGQRKDVADFYSAADIFLFPPQYEPFGNVVLEAMAYGCVSFTNQNCGMANFISEEYLINQNTPKLIETLLNNPEKLSQEKTKSRALASEYSIEKTAHQTLEIINQTLKNKFKKKRIVLSKVNQIGDVVFALPLAYLLKQADPDCEIIFLGRSYTESLINKSLDIDEFADWEKIQTLSQEDQVQAFKDLNADIFIHIYPQKSIAYLAKQAKIPVRIGTSHRIYHWLTCNQLVSISRKKSKLHETQLDLILLKPLFNPLGLRYLYSLPEIIPMRRFKNSNIQNPNIHSKLNQKFNLILHPLTRGRHIEWPLKNYAELIKYLDPDKFNIFITGSESEGLEIRPYLIQPFLNTHPHLFDLTGKLSLEGLLNFLETQTDGLICSSTGPIHLAAAFGKPVLGLYAPIKPFDAGRWGPVGSQAEVLSLNKNCSDCRDGSRCVCVGLIEVGQVLKIIKGWERLGKVG